MDDLRRDVRLAADAALEAGRAVMRSFGSDMDVQHKAPDQPLTASDLEADRILRTRLLAARPDYGWLSEETADDAARLGRERVWIVDPIDGTRTFIRGRREFAVSVGLARHGVAVAGVVLNPATGELYAAWSGGGAWKLEHALEVGEVGEAGSAGSAWHRIELRAAPADRPTILASRGEIRDGDFDVFAGWPLYPLGSTTYKLARLAEGVADVFLSRGPKSEWDLCAGDLLVQEAGGIVSDMRGQPLRYNGADPRVYGILAASAALHARVLDRLAGLPLPERLLRRAVDPLHPGLEEV